MAGKILTRQFFERNTCLVARDLLGKFLVRKIGNRTMEAMITETEAYCGEQDLACHASRGRTKRTEIMYGAAGHAYIYMIYGMYYCLNAVTRVIGEPEAVLIRGVLDTDHHHDGPGKLCRHLHIDKKLNGLDLTIKKQLWIEDRGTRIPKRQIIRTPRIGIDYAGSYRDKKWRYVIDEDWLKTIRW